ncbi:hypothetical protein OAory_01005210 [Aspergillus oryzae]|uniref:Mid2 domain-containing protein n=1 Tax=Aspergillus oryzae TaxID=5062 RepID=A0A1S9DUP6_ASPOZ|nr:hypothetical protein OAory_01005210 [Aspergillus oryzae]
MDPLPLAKSDFFQFFPVDLQLLGKTKLIYFHRKHSGMDHPIAVVVRDLLAGPSSLHSNDRAREQPDCGARCDVWLNKRLLWDASEPFIGPETTINTENFPAATQAAQTAMATAEASDITFQREANSEPDYVESLTTTISSLQSEATSIQSVPPMGNRPTGLPYNPVITAPPWSSVSSLTTTTRLATQPETTSTAAPTTTQSALEENSSGGDGINTKTTIAIAVPVSVVGLALFAGLLFFFLKRRRQEKKLISASNPHTLTPDTQSLNRELRPPPSADSRNGVRGRFTEQVHSIYAPDGSPMALTAENMSHHEQHTPRSSAWPLSPFGDPVNINNNDDAGSVVSRLSDRPGATQNRDMDDVSSISSIDDNERRRNTRP